MISICSVLIQESIEPLLFQHLLDVVGEAKKKRIQRFFQWQDKQRVLLADLLIRKMVMATTGLANSDISFQQNSYGKPFINHNLGIHFNLSHSGDWIVGAIDHLPVGIDVEQIRSIDLSISERFFSPQEHDALMAKKEDQRLDYFFSLWTLKESYMKAVGKGFSISLSSFTITVQTDNRIILTIDGHQQSDKHFSLYPLARDYKLAVCRQKNEFPRSIENISQAHLINTF